MPSMTVMSKCQTRRKVKMNSKSERDLILSICIPTYNRAAYIGETLESIIPQLDDDVEILIVDGASTDNTEDVVRQYTMKETRIRYIRLPIKGGPDQDYDKSVQLAYGKYCWLFSDDDIFRPGAVNAVKSAIHEDHDLVVVNAEMRTCDLSKRLVRKHIAIDENKKYGPDDTEDLFIDSAEYLMYIGAIVIRRSIWLSRERESYYGTDFVHVGVIFQSPLPGSSLIISEPYIIIRYGNSQWIPRSFDIWMFKWPKLIWSFHYISSKAKQIVCGKEPWRSLRNLVAERSRGSYNIQMYYRYFSVLHMNPLWKICAWLIARFPRKIFIGAHYCYNRTS
jgi:abequosyltransferase